MHVLRAGGCAVLCITLSCTGIMGKPGPQLAAHRSWVESREESLASETGYLALAGLYWLEPGTHTIGSDPSNAIVFPAGRAAARVGRIEFDARTRRATFFADPDVEVTCAGKPVTRIEMWSDVSGRGPTEIRTGELTFWLIERSGRTAVRLRDPKSRVRSSYRGTRRYPFSEEWQVEARFEPRPGETMAVPTVMGTQMSQAVRGVLHFELAGQSHTLHASGSGDKLFVIVGDKTNGKQTYGGGRFLDVMAEEGETVVLDFNRLRNPPCAYSPYTTCPMVPATNRLPLRIEAGERKPRRLPS